MSKLLGIICIARLASSYAVPDLDISQSLFSRQDISEAAWPYGPLSTQGRDIVNAKGEPVTWAGVNWPGSGETMVPEGLEWASVEDIVDQIHSVGFNFVRLTYAIESVDQIYLRNMTDVPLEVAMINALGYENGTKVTREIVSKNPGWTKDTGRFEIWDHIAQVAASRQIYIHPGNQPTIANVWQSRMTNLPRCACRQGSVVLQQHRWQCMV